MVQVVEVSDNVGNMNGCVFFAFAPIAYTARNIIRSINEDQKKHFISETETLMIGSIMTLFITIGFGVGMLIKRAHLGAWISQSPSIIQIIKRLFIGSGLLYLTLVSLVAFICIMTVQDKMDGRTSELE